MLAFTAKSFLKQNEDRARNRLPRLTSFDQIFKEEITGVEVLHSQSAQAQYLSRYGALGYTSPALKRWLDRWILGGGIAVR